MGTDPDFGRFRNFIGKLKEAFEPCNSEGNALEDLKALRIGDTPIDKNLAKYKMLVTKAKLKDDNPIVSDLFLETLSTSLQRQLLTLEKPPKLLKEWYKWASRLNNNYKRMNNSWEIQKERRQEHRREKVELLQEQSKCHGRGHYDG